MADGVGYIELNNSDIDADDKPSATINFGIYRGNDRIINFREVMP